ncbi:MAG TPA: hypothetical protein VMG31_12750 [Verrucomicrobiae bacterium]|nr:hypothetical protein [Verrucomicrobiae bacterium]
MASRVEYHVGVRRLIPATIGLFASLAVAAVLISPAFAQINGAPASVTSPGFGGRAVNGPPASVTSLGPRGYAPSGRATFSTSAPAVAPPHEGHHHHQDPYPEGYGAVYAVPVPYAVDAPPPPDDATADDSDSDYQGGPTVFDRRGSGADSYVPPAANVPRPHGAQTVEDLSATQPQESTVLVFKDGHTLEVANYAIVGSTLFDLTPGQHRKIPLSDFDLDATRKQNDDRGVMFQVPTLQQAN